MHSVIRANALVEASYKPESVWQMRLLFAALSQITADIKITHKTTFAVTVDTLADITGQAQKTMYRHLQRAAGELMDMKVTVELNPDGSPRGRRRRVINLVAQCEYIDEEARVEMEFTHSIIPYVTNLQQKFNKVKLAHVVPMQSAHSIRLYELLMSWSFAGEKEIETDDLRHLMGLAGRYPKFHELRRRVLEIAVEEINKYTPLHVKMTGLTRGRGRTITHVQFLFDADQVAEAPALAEPPEAPEPTLPQPGDPAHLVNKLSPGVFERVAELGLSQDKYALAGEWADWVSKQDIQVKNPAAHFFDFCKKRKAREQTK